jgi:hypothetical protein
MDTRGIDRTNVVCGAFFILAGLVFGYQSLEVDLGTWLRIGPGGLPLVLSALLILLGAIILAQALRVEGEPVGRIAWRGMVFILLAPLIFGPHRARPRLRARRLRDVALRLLRLLPDELVDGAPSLLRAGGLLDDRLQLRARPALPAFRPLAAVLGGATMDLFCPTSRSASPPPPPSTTSASA